MIESIEFFVPTQSEQPTWVQKKFILDNANTSEFPPQCIDIETCLNFLSFGTPIYLKKGNYGQRFSIVGPMYHIGVFTIFLHGKSK